MFIQWTYNSGSLRNRCLTTIASSYSLSSPSAHILVSEPDDVSLWQLCISCSIDARVRVVVFMQPDLRLVVDAEIRKLGLSRYCDLATNVCHLKSLLSQVPLVPMVVWLNMFLDEMGWARDTLVNHEWCRDAE